MLLAILAIVVVAVVVNAMITMYLLNRQAESHMSDMEELYAGMLAIDNRLLEVVPAYEVKERKTPIVEHLIEKPETTDWMKPLWESDEDTQFIDRRRSGLKTVNVNDWRKDDGPPPMTTEELEHLAQINMNYYTS